MLLVKLLPNEVKKQASITIACFLVLFGLSPVLFVAWNKAKKTDRYVRLHLNFHIYPLLAEQSNQECME